MRHHFLLDENTLYHAVRGVNEFDERDLAAARLVLLIAQNCHRIVLNGFVLARYEIHLRQLQRERIGPIQALYLLQELVYNSAKAIRQDEDPPALPGSAHIPIEDINIVRAALVTHPIFVSNEEGLRQAINECEALHLRAVSAAEALLLASEPSEALPG